MAMRVTFCAACGRMILRSFEYCPYCGRQVEEAARAGFEEAVREPFERLERAAGQAPASPRDVLHGDAVSRRIDRLLGDLARLETEMETLEAYSGASK